jgi:hypothetical protein
MVSNITCLQKRLQAIADILNIIAEVCAENAENNEGPRHIKGDITEDQFQGSS